MRLIGVLCILLGGTGCSGPEPRSAEYFMARPGEARQIVAGCAAGSVRGEECSNAAQAIEEANGRERFRRFRGK